MLLLCLKSLGMGLCLGLWALFPLGSPWPYMTLKRWLLTWLLVPALLLFLIINWLCLLADELLFPSYRRCRIKQPVFVVGLPRSGTTHLHRVLAQDQRYTTMTTWECIFAPSILQRKIILLLIALDRKLGKPMTTLLGWLQKRLLGSVNAVHPTALNAPEEDYLALLSSLDCFILFLLFPFSQHIWTLGSFDRDAKPARKQQLLDFYQRLIQRHLYVHGEARTYLCKNASFAPLTGCLKSRFPDAKWFCSLRDPVEVVCSQLAALQPGLEGLGFSNTGKQAVYQRLATQLSYYFDNLMQQLEPMEEHHRVILPMANFSNTPGVAVKLSYRQLDIPMSEQYAKALQGQDNIARTFRPKAEPEPQRFGLSAARIRELFSGHYQRYRQP